MRVESKNKLLLLVALVPAYPGIRGIYQYFFIGLK